MATAAPGVEAVGDKEEASGNDCMTQGVVYGDGSAVPSSSECQTNCRCNNGTVMCERPSCPPAPATFLRCSAVPPTEGCCPTYDCPPIVDPTVTEAPECERDGVVYSDGEYVPSASECTDCYCLGGEIICAYLECVAPGDNCTPVSHPNNTCCPDKYECPDEPESMVATTVVPIGAAATTYGPQETTTTGAPSVTEDVTQDTKPEVDLTTTGVTASTESTAVTDEDIVGVSVITEASVATDGLDTEPPSATVSSFVTEPTVEVAGSTTEAATPDMPVTDVETASTDAAGQTTTPATTSEAAVTPASTSEPIVTEASVATEEPDTEPTVGVVVDVTTPAPVSLVTEASVTDATEGVVTSEATATTTESTMTSTEAPVPDITTESHTSTSVTEASMTRDTDETDEPVSVTASSEATVAGNITTTEAPATTVSTTTTEAPATTVSTTTTEAPTTTVSTTTTTELPFPPFPGFTTTVYPSETTTWKPSTSTEIVLGPGACVYDGEVYLSAQQIPRDDPCDFCFCFRGDIICLQQTCPPPIPGCYEEPIPGFCCPRYECPVTQAIVNITTTTTPIPTYPPVQRTQEVVMCEIGDNFYHPGEIVEEASGPCLECRCGKDGMMECEPLECRAEPMLRQILDTKSGIYGR